MGEAKRKRAGTLEVLNVGAGDVRIVVDSPESKATARSMIGQMLRDGYAIVVEDEDGAHRSVEGFDEAHDEYIVAGLPRKGGKKKAEDSPSSEDPIASVKKRGSWADIVVRGEPFSTSRALRYGEAKSIVERINKGQDPTEAAVAVLAGTRKKTSGARATAIAPSAGG